MVDRRSFLKTAGLAGSGLLLGFMADAAGSTSLVNLAGADTNTLLAFELNPFIIIDNSGGITLINNRPEMGQGSFQAVPTMIAEELEVGLDQVVIQQSNGLAKYGNQFAVGSSTVRSSWQQMRTVGAAAREMLIQAAAQRWNVPAEECYAKRAVIYHRPTNKTLTYGAVADDAAKLPVPKNPTLKAKKDFTLLGKPVARPDIPAKVTGKAVFGIDMEVPGMLYASVEHSPVIHGKIVSIDDSAARKIPGVKDVVRCERVMPQKTVEAVAVVATSYWAALQGRRALVVTWDKGQYEQQMTTDRFYAELRNKASQPADTFYTTGNVNTAYEAAPKKLDAQYETPFLAHAPMEPEVTIAHVKDNGSCELWASVQGPDQAIRQVADYLKIKPEQVTAHVPFLGGGLGRKGFMDFVLEAVSISKQVKAPVKLIWTREDDISQGPFRTGMLSAMRGAVDASGNPVAFEHKAISESIMRQVFRMPLGDKPDTLAKEGIGKEESPYAFPNASAGFINVQTEIPVTFWRSVYPSTTAFGHESFIDELAHLGGKDPLQMRLDLLKAQTEGEAAHVAKRFSRVLETLREKADWNKPLPAGQGKGLAIFHAFGSICAHVVFVTKKGKGVSVNRVVSVLDCGQYVNPDMVRAQTEGNIVMGLTAATKSGITFLDGHTVQTNFHDYQMVRMPDMPAVDIHLIDNDEQPGGVGEPGLPPVAPALCNAIFAATGKRLRKLPIDLENIS